MAGPALFQLRLHVDYDRAWHRISVPPRRRAFPPCVAPENDRRLPPVAVCVRRLLRGGDVRRGVPRAQPFPQRGENHVDPAEPPCEKRDGRVWEDPCVIIMFSHHDAVPRVHPGVPRRQGPVVPFMVPRVFVSRCGHHRGSARCEIRGKKI